MRGPWHTLPRTILATWFVLLLTACGISNPAFLSGTGSAAVAVTLTGPGTVMLGGQSQYAATVTGSSDPTVTWSVNGVGGGNSTVGSISNKGLYIAPKSAPQSSSITITATSVARPSVSKSLPVALAAPPTGQDSGTSPVTLTLAGPAAVMLGASSSYVATVTGTSNTAVSWSINGVLGGNTDFGTISATGLYTAPATAPQGGQVIIAATSVADPSVSEGMTITLTPPQAPGGNGAGSSVTLALSGAITVTLGTSAQYTATIAGSGNTGVTWSINGIAGGSSTLGTISARGLYTAPAKQPSSSKVTITATSAADPSVSSSLVVSLVASSQPPGGAGDGPSVTLALSGATTVMLTKTARYSAIVTGSSDTAVAWSVDGVTGGDTTLGTISVKGLYTAPAHAPRSSKVTIAATSKADPSVSQSLVVALVAQPTPPLTVTLTLSGPASVLLGNSSQYAATVTGSSNIGVKWGVDGIVGGDSSVGAISSAGRYTAPAKAPASSKVTISATSMADPSVSQSMIVTLSAPQPTVALTLTGAATVTLGTSSKYTATVTGTSNTGVIWSVNGKAGGNTADGVISAAGLYSAPTTAPQPSTITITATSAADSKVAKSIVVTLVAPVGSGSRIPANAIRSADLDALTNWHWTHDSATPGGTQGSTQYPVAGFSADDTAREFYMTYSNGGGERYSVSFARDTKATHFVYDVNVYIVDPSQLKNLEMDMNDVMANGQTVILATQCSGHAKAWEYTLRTATGYHWVASNIPCDPSLWAANTWHHIQIASHRDSSGNAYYDWISFDGKYNDLQNANGPNGRDLGWQVGTLLINFQIDGPSQGSGKNVIYTDKLYVWRW